MAIPEDAPQMRDCIEGAYGAYRASINDLPDVAGGLEDDIAQSRAWVAEWGGTLAGVLVLAFSDDAVTIVNVAVDPTSQGQGIGKMLMAAADDQARARGQTTLRLTTHAKMPKNVTLYERFGWAVVSRDARKVQMEKRLAD